MPCWPISLWPKVNVNYYKLRFCGYDRAALLWQWITNTVPGILVMPQLKALILRNSSRLFPAWLLPRPALQERSYPHFGLSRLCPWLQASGFHWYSGYSAWMHLLIHHTTILNWKSYSELVNTNLVFSFPSLLCLANFVSHSAFGSLVSLKEFWGCVHALLLFCRKMNKRMIGRLIHQSLLHS